LNHGGKVLVLFAIEKPDDLLAVDLENGFKEFKVDDLLERLGMVYVESEQALHEF